MLYRKILNFKNPLLAIFKDVTKQFILYYLVCDIIFSVKEIHFVVQRETGAVLLLEMGIPLTAVSFGEHEQCLVHC